MEMACFPRKKSTHSVNSKCKFRALPNNQGRARVVMRIAPPPAPRGGWCYDRAADNALVRPDASLPIQESCSPHQPEAEIARRHAHRATAGAGVADEIG